MSPSFISWGLINPLANIASHCLLGPDLNTLSNPAIIRYATYWTTAHTKLVGGLCGVLPMLNVLSMNFSDVQVKIVWPIRYLRLTKSLVSVALPKSEIYWNFIGKCK